MLHPSKADSQSQPGPWLVDRLLLLTLALLLLKTALQPFYEGPMGLTPDCQLGPGGACAPPFTQTRPQQSRLQLPNGLNARPTTKHARKGWNPHLDRCCISMAPIRPQYPGFTAIPFYFASHWV